MKDYNTKKWYIATTIIGSEEKIKEALMEKIIAYKFENEVSEMTIIKHKEITIEEFNDTTNPPPKTMRNSKNIEWRSTPKGYEKITSKEINRFPGYLFIKMIMTQDVWYTIRNTTGITGFIGSSGKGTQPIPISDFELENIFDKEKNKDKIIRISGKTITEENVMPILNLNIDKKNVNVEYFDSKALVSESNNINKNISNNLEDNKSDIFTEKESSQNSTEEKNDFTEGKVIVENFEVGNEVVIINGTLIGSSGLIKEVFSDKKTLLLEVEILGSQNLIELPWKDVVK